MKQSGLATKVYDGAAVGCGFVVFVVEQMVRPSVCAME
jgi:hypothetical protein